tara:strand:- start:440 stop:1588 length:1149 start_codon:yes stop_codon:yes gene_type:complete
MINVVILCTNLIQLLQIKSLLDIEDQYFLSKNNVHIIIYNPYITKKVYETIKDEATKLKFKNVFYLDKMFAEKVNNRYSIKNKIIKRFNHIRKLENFFNKYIKKIDRVYVRSNIKREEITFLNKFCTSAKVISVDDGIGSFYNSNKNDLYHLGGIKNKINQFLTKYFLFLIIFFLTLNVTTSRSFTGMSLDKTFKKINNGSNIHHDNLLNKFDNKKFANFFLNNLNKLCNVRTNKKSQIEIIIIGTINRAIFKSDLYLHEEINQINKLINEIKIKYNVSSKKILYKHHPRLEKKIWNIKYKKIDCLLYDFNKKDIADKMIYSNKQLKAVFAFNSSIAIYSEKLYKVPTYIIDISKRLNDKSILKTDYSDQMDTFRRLKVKFI